MNEILKIENLTIKYECGDEKCRAVDNISLSINEGDAVGIIGESGSGKTTIAMAIMGLLKEKASIEGEIFFHDKDILNIKEEDKDKYRWKDIALVFQNTEEVLNPVMSVGEQIEESMYVHNNISKDYGKIKLKELFNLVNLDEKWIKAYPHELSGGMRQKVLIAMALSCNPKILIVDEPTTALDPVGKQEVVSLIKKLRKEKNITMIVISHELPVILELTSNLKVMYKGMIVEEGFTKDIVKNPMHTYTRGLINSSLEVNPFGDLWGIPYELTSDNEEGCPFCFRCVQSTDLCRIKKPELKNVLKNRNVACNRGGIITLLTAKEVKKTYNTKKQSVEALKGCSIEIKSGEVVALIGQSGSGKTTLANILCGMLDKDFGEVKFKEKEILGNSATKIKGGIQMVFQDPFSAINGNFTILEAVREPLDIIKDGDKESRDKKVIEALLNVQLPTSQSFLKRRCSGLSGGQRQRIAIARSLVMEPKLLIADEISSMLDPSTKANILRLLKGLQNSKGFAMIYITHDIKVARKIADKVFVMYNGNIIEEGSVLQIFENPKHPYTQKITAS